MASAATTSSTAEGAWFVLSAFQRQLTSAEAQLQTGWEVQGLFSMATGAPRSMPPQQAVEWLINCRNPAAQGWVFVGRWLSLANPPTGDLPIRDRSSRPSKTFAALFTPGKRSFIELSHKLAVWSTLRNASRRTRERRSPRATPSDQTNGRRWYLDRYRDDSRDMGKRASRQTGNQNQRTFTRYRR